MHCSSALDYVKSGNNSQLVCHNVVTMGTYPAVDRDEVVFNSLSDFDDVYSLSLGIWSRAVICKAFQ